MTGYQETITDPSYARQLVVQTAPHIGNTGVNSDDAESRRIWVAGYIVRDAARRPSNWRSERCLDEELVEQGIVGIQGVDTRAITRHLREHKTMRAGIFSGDAVQRHGQGTVDTVLAQRPDGRLTPGRGSQRRRGLHRGTQGPRLGRRAAVQHRRDRPRHQGDDPHPLRRARRPRARAAGHRHPGGRPGGQPGRLLYVQRPRRPRHRRRPGQAAPLRPGREAARTSASASATRSWAAPWASAPTSCATATAASTSP